MMRAPRFRYVAAASVADAAAELAEHGTRAQILAGGTDLVPNMKRRQQTPAVLVSLREVHELDGVVTNGEVRIGACTTLSDVVEQIRAPQHDALRRAASLVATPLIRNAATIGGNLCLDTRCNYYNQNYEWRRSIDFCKKAPAASGGRAVESVSDENESICWVAVGSPRCWAVSSSDSAPALIALDARVTLVSAEDGERDIPLTELYNDDGMRFLTKRHDEVLTSVRVPALEGWRSTYWKLRRRDSFDFPVLGVAAAIRLGQGNVVEEARVALGAVASRPILLDETAMLLGKPLTDDAIEEFAETAAKWAKPLDNTDFQMTWRKRIAKTFLAGAIKELRGDDPATLPLLARHASRSIATI